MRRLSLLAFALALATPALAAQESAPAPAPPYQLVRTLQSLQNEAAAGNRAAHAAQTKLLRDLEQAMAAQPAAVGVASTKPSTVTLRRGFDPNRINPRELSLT